MWPISPVSFARRRRRRSRGAGARCRRSRARPAWSTSLTKRTSSSTSLSSASLNGSSSSTTSRPFERGVLARLADRLRRPCPRSPAREDLAVPVVLADDEQHVAGAEVGALVDVRLDPVEREALYGGVEVDEAEPDADDRADRQADLLARLLDLAALVVRQVERILEHVVGVEPDLLRRADPLQTADLRAEPGRADHSEFHAILLGARGVSSGRSTDRPPGEAVGRLLRPAGGDELPQVRPERPCELVRHGRERAEPRVGRGQRGREGQLATAR